MIEDVKNTIDTHPWILMAAPILIVGIVAYFFLTTLHTSPTQETPPPNIVSTTQINGKAATSQPENAQNPQTTQNSGFNAFAFILRLLGLSSSPTTQTTNATSQHSAGTGQQSSQSSQTGTNTNQNTNATGTNGSGQSTPQNANSGTGGSGNSSSTGSGGSSSNQVPIIFKSPDGGTQEYYPPTTPPVSVTWGRYVNADDRFSIDYPSNWQVVKTQYNGHEGISLYLPGTDPTDPNAQYIGFGTASYYLLPAVNSLESTYTYGITVGSTNGTMYTQGVLGNGSVAAVFSYEQGSFGLGSNVSDPDFIYVYNYMLQSLTFGPQ